MTLDQMDQMVRNANPVPHPDVLEAVGAPPFAPNRTGSADVENGNRLAHRDHESPRRRSLIPVAAGLVAVAVAATIIVLGAGAGTKTPVGDTVPTTPSTTLPTDAPLGLELVGLDGATSNLGLPTDAWMADLSPDGRKVVFVTTSVDLGSCRGCDQGGTVVRLAVVPVGSDTGGYVSFAADLDSIAQPAWSPDGTHLAFQGSVSGNLDIYVADLTEAVTQGSLDIGVPVTRLTTDPAVDEFPSWSPDGTVLYYDNLGTGIPDSGVSPTGEIWSVPAAGGDPTKLTDNDVADMQPDAGPDGTIAYWSGGDIRIMAPDGSASRRLSMLPGNLGWNPRWSPDGTKLAVLHYDSSSPRAIFEPNPMHPTDLPPMDVIVVDVRSGETTPLDVQVASFFNPVSWTPDGTAVLVTRYR
jgi:WD40-like Beta Propeller Repeat